MSLMCDDSSEQEETRVTRAWTEPPQLRGYTHIIFLHGVGVGAQPRPRQPQVQVGRPGPEAVSRQLPHRETSCRGQPSHKEPHAHRLIARRET
eukprot:2136572-Prymnesium_polylepis.1